MGFLLSLLGIVGLLLVLLWFIRADPARVANAVRFAPSSVVALSGVIAFLFGRRNGAFLLITVAAAMFRRAKQTGGRVSRESPKSSVVRTVWLEMELDHDTGNMDGLMLQGLHQGVPFSMMDEVTLWAAYAEASGDTESAALFETYFDRVTPLWRDSAHARNSGGQRTAPSSGTMSEKEAYDILGLDPGAGPEVIRKAHRRLMQRVHPDLGGNDFLAARINAAKDLLMSTHRKT